MLILDRLKHVLDYPLVHFAAGPLTLGTLLLGVAIIVAARFVATVVTRGLTRMLTRREVHDSARFAVVKIARYVIIFLGILIAINSVGLKLDALLEASAALLVGIGFGLQTIAQNFISGLILLIERPVGMGDFVQIGNASGSVVDIGLRATTVVTRDEVTIIVPNSELITGQVINHSIPTPRRRISVAAPAAYGSDAAAVKRILLAVAAGAGSILTDPAPEVRLESFGESSLNFSLLGWIANPSQDLRAASDLRFAIEAAFRAGGITIPFPQRDVHVRSGAALADGAKTQ
jgi:small-conductance mechanosensitive channel